MSNKEVPERRYCDACHYAAAHGEPVFYDCQQCVFPASPDTVPACVKCGHEALFSSDDGFCRKPVRTEAAKDKSTAETHADDFTACGCKCDTAQEDSVPAEDMKCANCGDAIYHSIDQPWMRRTGLQTCRNKEGIFHAEPTPDGQAIEVLTVLDGLRGQYVADCWCDAEGDSPHWDNCDAARALHHRLSTAPSPSISEQYGDKERCHAQSDGDCNWESCPQLANHQPHCPLDTWIDPDR